MYDREPPESIAELIKWIRERRGISQRELAEALVAASGRDTVTRGDISRWERGKRIPTSHWLHWLSHVLEIPLPTLQYAASLARRERLLATMLRPQPWTLLPFELDRRGPEANDRQDFREP
ncbi:helix-turn-helix domain-containing protein [Amycolatopsis decaplanina]|uniref:Putative XRE family transcriptional regulator n=1 Tax=Amycolatopsis decaplanina DSM 44594 TaxID=1284240 RepID=M2ZE51_9PSEU|nr:helix-turn-helix transcriptional regulator [Amycolatopsis decaplanina]EME58609.1 putative XRE family transcriptional regulator [Amycolatopsis decaplanina DSM 44594]